MGNYTNTCIKIVIKKYVNNYKPISVINYIIVTLLTNAILNSFLVNQLQMLEQTLQIRYIT